MNRITAILLSIFVLLLAAHPAVLLHFCSGDLASVSVVESQTMSGCCPDEQSQDATSIQIGNTCCHDYTIELSTDDYTPPSHHSQVDLQEFHHLVALYAFATVFGRVAESPLPSEYKDRRPILYETGRDVLSRFCVYII